MNSPPFSSTDQCRQFIIWFGSQVMTSGQIRNTATVRKSATTKGPTPRNTVETGISGLTADTTKQFSPMGGVTRQTSAIFTTMMPNQIGS